MNKKNSVLIAFASAVRQVIRNRRRIILVLFGLALVLIAGSGLWRVEPIASQVLVTPFIPTLRPTLTPGPTPRAPFPPPPSPLWPTGIPQFTRPTSIATLIPFPTRTPLPSVVPGRSGRLWAENLAFGAPARLGKDLQVPFQHIEWSPDGNQIAISLFTGEWIKDQAGKPQWEITRITLVGKTGQSVVSLVEGFDPYWSPDAANIAYLARIGGMMPLYIRVVNVQTKQVTQVAAIGNDGVYPTLAWLSPSELAFYFKDQPMIFDLRNRQTKPLLDPGLLAQIDRSTLLRNLGTAPGKGILAVGSGKEILLLKWVNGTAQLIRRIEGGADNSRLAISPDGELLAYPAVALRLVKIVGVYDKNINIELPSCRSAPIVGNWSPDGVSLLFDCDGAMIVNRDGSGLRSIPNVSGAWPPIWSPSGEWITWVSGDLGLSNATVVRQR